MSVHGGLPGPGGMPGRGVSGPEGVPVWGVLGLVGAWSQGGACSGGGLLRGVPGGDPPMATAAGGTHPTGMHSCFVTFLPKNT